MPSTLRAAALALPLALLCAAPAAAAPELEPVGSFAAPTYVDLAARRPAPVRHRARRAGADRRQGRGRQARALPRHLEPDHDGRRARPALDRVPARLHGQRARVRLRDRRRRVAADPRVPPLADRPQPSGARRRPPRAQPGARGDPQPQRRPGPVRPDGLLYAGFGDGGGTRDPDHNGQSLDTLLGKLIRIDPRRPPAAPPTPIPPDNPFAGRPPGATRSGPTGCATPTGSPSTARPATCGSATSGRTPARRSTAPWPASAARTTAGAATRGRSRRP